MALKQATPRSLTEKMLERMAPGDVLLLELPKPASTRYARSTTSRYSRISGRIYHCSGSKEAPCCIRITREL